MSSIIAMTALLASAAVAASVGSAVVLNGCTYEIYLADVPASGGGYQAIDKTLQPNETWSQQWTELTNGNGWSIKLSKDNSWSDIMQYEYTFHNDGGIWFDLSEVNGNPWNGNWEITAESPSSTCEPKQAAYRYATDDAYGMQYCPQDAVITVTLCSGESQNNGSAASASLSAAALSSSIATASGLSMASTPISTPSIVAPTIAPASSNPAAYTGPHHWRGNQNNAAVSPATTLSTVTTPAAVYDLGGVTVTEIETAIVTEFVTAYNKRHEHHPRHNRA